MTTDAQTTTTQTQTPTPQAQGGVDVAAIMKAAVDAATKAMAPVVQGLTDQVKALQDAAGKTAEDASAAGGGASGASGGAPLTAEGIAKLVADQLAAQSAGQEKKAARASYIAAKMKDVPDAYHSALGDDPAKWADQEQAIRATLKGDLTKLGVKAENVGGDATAGGGDKPAAAIDTSKLSGIELIGMGVKASAGNATEAPATATATTQQTRAADGGAQTDAK